MTASRTGAVLDMLPQVTLDLLPVPVFLTSVPDGRILRCNQRAVELCGGDAGVPDRLCELLHGLGDAVCTDQIAMALQNGSPLRDTEAVLEAAGRQIAVSIAIAPIRDVGDRVSASLTICHAIARGKDAEAAAAAQRLIEQRLTLALKAGKLGTWELDLNTRVLTSSAQCKANHGLQADEDLQLETNLIPAIDFDHRARFRATLEHAIETEGSFEIEVPHRWPDESRHWLLIAGSVFDSTYMVGVSQDITDRRQNEQGFRDSERRYREIVETANEGIWTLDDQAKITFVNRRMADLVGYLPGEMIGQRKWDFMFGEDVAAMKALFERRRLGVAEEVVDIRFRHHDGREIWTLMAARPLHDGAGRFIGALDLFSDITERRRAEQALRDSEERFRTLADNIAQLAWMADETGRVFWYNRRWFEYTGRTLEEMQGWGWQEVHHPDHVQSVIEKISRCFETGEIWEDTFPLRARDGTYRWFLSRALPIRDERGAITRWFGTNTDVTDRREAEEALLEADRRKDEFLAVVAHELRGPLAPILTAARILQMKGPPDSQLQKPRETIIRQTMQLSKLVDDLLDVGRITAGKLWLDKRRVELNEIVKQAVETSAPVIERRRHTLNVAFSEAPVYLDVDAARMVQVVGNLLNNAAKYMQEGGRIDLTAFADGDTAVIRVRDEGVGIPPDMLGRIFQRFIQLGSSGHRAEGGLGIGLSLVKALVDLHGGSVDARSDGIGTGSEFTVRLPITRP
jgi:PAS domain S-box-containing protein